jgi:general secretion pathway protein C
MWQREQLITGWLPRAPRWTAVLLCGLIVGDLAHSAWVLRPDSKAGPAEPPLLQQARANPFIAQHVATAHLFGASAASDAGAANASETRIAFALNGIIATNDPNEGYAILGEQGKPTHLYRAGAAVESTQARLFRVFADRVVLDFGGRLETLRLPRSLLPGMAYQAVVMETMVAAAEAPATAATVTLDPRQRSPAQSVLGSMFAEPNNVDGRMVGMVMHPARRLQRQYGFRDGDMLTAVNGVEINDPDVLQNVLTSSSGKSLSLTFTRDGVQQTKTLPVGN